MALNQKKLRNQSSAGLFLSTNLDLSAPHTVSIHDNISKDWRSKKYDKHSNKWYTTAFDSFFKTGVTYN